ncbi:hypothetical protein [Bacteriophage Titan-X]|uniref:Uncharacterized protein n=1 Tax=Bacteriophage Titan-X TaxID=2662140 RepID=A0A5Q2UAG1_9CAUD|nr:hypothetical protein [Bacteriophage Titan-X]
MADNVHNFIRVTIPEHMLGDGEVQARVDEVTKIAGGVSMTPSRGEWFDDKGERHVDQNVVMQWNFKAGKRHLMTVATGRVVNAMFFHGEKAVFRERWFNDEVYRASILYAPTHTT